MLFFLSRSEPFCEVFILMEALCVYFYVNNGNNLIFSYYNAIYNERV